MMARFVIVVDTQQDFMVADGALSVAGAEALIPAMREWLASLDPADTAGLLFTFDTHDPESYAGSPESEAFPIHCIRESAGWANVLDAGAVDARIPVYRIEKHVFDMWHEPGLSIENARDAARPRMNRDAFFEALRRDGVREVTVIGVAADYCVRWAIDGLVARGFAVTVPAALTRGIGRSIERVVEEDFPAGAVRVAA